jgi:hypothetical protein
MFDALTADVFIPVSNSAFLLIKTFVVAYERVSSTRYVSFFIIHRHA